MLSAHLIVFVLVISGLGSRCGRNGSSKRENQSTITSLFIHHFLKAAMQSFSCLKNNFVAELLDKKQTQTLKNA
jgi:hypothetical protein